MSEFQAEFGQKEPIKEISLNVKAETLARKGKTENQNEDSNFFNSKNNSFAVLDGFGGEANGREASQFCSNLLQKELGYLSKDISPVIATEKFKQITEKINQSFIQIQEGNGGATAVFGIICHDESGNKKAIIANLGDSRAYLFSPDNRELKNLTTDDSTIKLHESNPLIVAEIQKHLDEVSYSKQLDSNEMEYFKERNKVTSGFGDPGATPHLISVDLKPNDILILTSDGIHDNLTTSEISEILSSNRDPNKISKELIKQSLARSQDLNHLRHKADDMTAMAIKVEDIKIDQTEILDDKEFFPKVGDTIYVQRSMMSGGGIEGGWKINFINSQNELVVHKGEGQNTVTKILKIKEVERFNRPPKPDDITTAIDFPQLFFTLEKMEKIPGTTGVFTSDTLIGLINKYRKGEISLTGITRTYGLRDVVERLSKKRN